MARAALSSTCHSGMDGDGGFQRGQGRAARFRGAEPHAREWGDECIPKRLQLDNRQVRVGIQHLEGRIDVHKNVAERRQKRSRAILGKDCIHIIADQNVHVEQLQGILLRGPGRIELTRVRQDTSHSRQARDAKES